MRLIRKNVERIAENEAVIRKLKEEGYQEVGMAAAEDPKGSEEEKAVEAMSTSQLKAIAKKQGIEGANSLSREELLEALKDVV